MLFDLITEENANYYRKLIPDIFVNRMFWPGAVCVGAAMELPGTGKSEPAGVLLLNIAKKDCLRIDFLQVNPDYREQEVGTLLLSQAFRLAKRMGIPKLTVKLPEEEENGGLEDSRAYFFLRRGFVRTEKTEREWWFPIESVQPFATLSMGKEEKKILPFSKLTKTQYQTILKQVETDLENRVIPFEERAIDRLLSFAYLEEGKLMGFLITERFGDTYYPFTFVNHTGLSRVTVLLFRTLLIAAARDGDPDGYAQILLANETQRDAVEKILRGISPVEMRILEAEQNSMDCTETHIKRTMELSAQARKEEEEFPSAFEIVGYEYYGGEVVELSAQEG